MGNALEWYDFFLFAAASALVFGRLFFPPGETELVGLLASFAAFGVGFVARPVGGLIFGLVGDRRGRTFSLLWTLSAMGVATCLIGLLPTYEQAGLWAVAGLVALRIVQGIAAGGEWGGGVLLISENSPAQRRGFLTAFSQTGVGLGFVLASAALYLARLLPDQAFYSWGWRLPFLMSFVLVPIGIAIRRRLPESTDFQHAKVQNRTPLRTLVRQYPRELIAAVGIRLAGNGASHLLTAFALGYGALIGVESSTLLAGATIGMVADSLMMPVFGGLSDRFGRKLVYAFGVAGSALFAWPFFLMLASGTSALVVLAFVIGNGLFHAAMIGVQPTLFSELFDIEVRYSGLSIAHEASAVLVGWLPLVATGILARTDSVAAIAGLMAGLSVLSLAALFVIMPVGEGGTTRHVSDREEV